MPTTALQMVNRVLRMMSEEDVLDLSSRLAIRVLDTLNESKRAIVDDQDWPQLFRSDGVFTTVDSFTGTTATFTKGSATVSFPIADSPNGVDADVVGTDRVSRIINTEDGTYGDQSFKILSGESSGGTFTATLETTFPGTTLSASADYRVFVSEYLLPETVESVESVTIEGENVTLSPIDESVTYDDLESVPHQEIGLPRLVMTGGKSVNSFVTSTGAADPLTRLLVSPIADDEYVVRYKYQYRYPDLSATTDTLAGIRESVIDLIVRDAFSLMNFSSIGNDPTLGAANQALVKSKQRDAQSIIQDGGRRLTVAPIDRRGNRSRRDVGGTLPRNFGSI